MLHILKCNFFLAETVSNHKKKKKEKKPIHNCETTRLLKELKEDPACLCQLNHDDDDEIIIVDDDSVEVCFFLLLQLC